MGFLVTMLKGKKGGVLSFIGLKTFCTEPAVPCGGMGMRSLALEESCVEGRRAVKQVDSSPGRIKSSMSPSARAHEASRTMLST